MATTDPPHEVAETVAGAAAEATEKAAGGGMPQLDFATYPSQIFWLIVSMVVLFFVLSRVALPRIASVLEARSGAIADDIDRAAEFKRGAEQAEQAYQAALAEARARAQGIAAEARVEIEAQIAEATARADAEIAAKTAESAARIAQVRDSALAAVSEVAADFGG